MENGSMENQQNGDQTVSHSEVKMSNEREDVNGITDNNTSLFTCTDNNYLSLGMEVCTYDNMGMGMGSDGDEEILTTSSLPHLYGNEEEGEGEGTEGGQSMNDNCTDTRRQKSPSSLAKHNLSILPKHLQLYESMDDSSTLDDASQTSQTDDTYHVDGPSSQTDDNEQQNVLSPSSADGTVSMSEGEETRSASEVGEEEEGEGSKVGSGGLWGDSTTHSGTSEGKRRRGRGEGKGGGGKQVVGLTHKGAQLMRQIQTRSKSVMQEGQRGMDVHKRPRLGRLRAAHCAADSSESSDATTEEDFCIRKTRRHSGKHSLSLPSQYQPQPPPPKKRKFPREPPANILGAILTDIPQIDIRPMVTTATSKEEETGNGVKESERKEEKGGKEGGSKEGRSKTRHPKDEEVKSDDTLSNHHKLLMSWEPDYPRGLNAMRAPVLFAIEKMEDKLKDIKDGWLNKAKVIWTTWRKLSVAERDTYCERAKSNRSRQKEQMASQKQSADLHDPPSNGSLHTSPSANCCENRPNSTAGVAPTPPPQKTSITDCCETRPNSTTTVAPNPPPQTKGTSSTNCCETRPNSTTTVAPTPPPETKGTSSTNCCETRPNSTTAVAPTPPPQTKAMSTTSDKSNHKSRNKGSSSSNRSNSNLGTASRDRSISDKVSEKEKMSDRDNGNTSNGQEVGVASNAGILESNAAKPRPQALAVTTPHFIPGGLPLAVCPVSSPSLPSPIGVYFYDSPPILSSPIHYPCVPFGIGNPLQSPSSPFSPFRPLGIFPMDHSMVPMAMSENHAPFMTTKSHDPNCKPSVKSTSKSTKKKRAVKRQRKSSASGIACSQVPQSRQKDQGVGENVTSVEEKGDFSMVLTASSPTVCCVDQRPPAVATASGCAAEHSELLRSDKLAKRSSAASVRTSPSSNHCLPSMCLSSTMTSHLTPPTSSNSSAHLPTPSLSLPATCASNPTSLPGNTVRVSPPTQPCANTKCENSRRICRVNSDSVTYKNQKHSPKPRSRSRSTGTESTIHHSSLSLGVSSAHQLPSSLPPTCSLSPRCPPSSTSLTFSSPIPVRPSSSIASTVHLDHLLSTHSSPCPTTIHPPGGNSLSTTVTPTVKATSHSYTSTAALSTGLVMDRNFATTARMSNSKQGVRTSWSGDKAMYATAGGSGSQTSYTPANYSAVSSVSLSFPTASSSNLVTSLHTNRSIENPQDRHVDNPTGSCNAIAMSILRQNTAGQPHILSLLTQTHDEGLNIYKLRNVGHSSSTYTYSNPPNMTNGSKTTQSKTKGRGSGSHKQKKSGKKKQTKVPPTSTGTPILATSAATCARSPSSSASKRGSERRLSLQLRSLINSRVPGGEPLELNNPSITPSPATNIGNCGGPLNLNFIPSAPMWGGNAGRQNLVPVGYKAATGGPNNDTPQSTTLSIHSETQPLFPETFHLPSILSAQKQEAFGPGSVIPVGLDALIPRLPTNLSLSSSAGLTDGQAPFSSSTQLHSGNALSAFNRERCAPFGAATREGGGFKEGRDSTTQPLPSLLSVSHPPTRMHGLMSVPNVRLDSHVQTSIPVMSSSSERQPQSSDKKMTSSPDKKRLDSDKTRSLPDKAVKGKGVRSREKKKQSEKKPLKKQVACPPLPHPLTMFPLSPASPCGAVPHAAIPQTVVPHTGMPDTPTPTPNTPQTPFRAFHPTLIPGQPTAIPGQPAMGLAQLTSPSQSAQLIQNLSYWELEQLYYHNMAILEQHRQFTKYLESELRRREASGEHIAPGNRITNNQLHNYRQFFNYITEPDFETDVSLIFSECHETLPEKTSVFEGTVDNPILPPELDVYGEFVKKCNDQKSKRDPLPTNS